EQHLGLGPQRSLLHLLLDPKNLGFGHLGRIGGVSDEPGDLGCVFDHVPGFIVENHVDEDVAWEELARRDLALAALAQFLHAFDRHQHLADLPVHVERAYALLEGGLGLVLIARVRVDHVPLHPFRPRVLVGFAAVFLRLRHREGSITSRCGCWGPPSYSSENFHSVVQLSSARTIRVAPKSISPSHSAITNERATTTIVAWM